MLIKGRTCVSMLVKHWVSGERAVRYFRSAIPHCSCLVVPQCLHACTCDLACIHACTCVTLLAHVTMHAHVTLLAHVTLHAHVTLLASMHE